MRKSGLLLLACLCLSMVGCDEFSGSLNIKEDIQLKKDKKLVAIPAGVYQAELQPKSDRRADIEIKIGKKKVAFKFEVPKGKKLASGDSFKILSQDSGQPFDVIGETHSTVDTTVPIQTIESCTYQVYEYRCHREQVPQSCRQVRECNPQDPNECFERQICHGGGTREVCGDERVTRYGDQRVEYYHRTDTDHIRLDLVKPGAEESVAELFGTRSENSKIYNWKDNCR